MIDTIAWIALGLGFGSALAILYDVFVRGYRQQMAVMNAVYPISALYWGPVALYYYVRRARHETSRGPLTRSDWWPVAKSTSHCGAGCTLGDIGGEWLVFAAGWTIPVFGLHAPDMLMAEYATDFVFAWSLGIVFQYFSIVPMRGLGFADGIRAAIKADTLSIIAFEIGLFGFMAIFQLVLFDPPLAVDSPSYWFMMQLGMIAGFLTSWPVNAWLIKRGIKGRM